MAVFNPVYSSSLQRTVSEQEFRLVTRSDFYGLVCAVLFKDLGMMDDILFVHPKDMQDALLILTILLPTCLMPFSLSRIFLFTCFGV
jgi:hypothetical protein